MGLLDAWKSDEQKEQEKRERLAPQYQRLKSAYQKMIEADPSARDEQTEALFSKYDSVFAGVKTPEQKIHEQISTYNENVQQGDIGEPLQRGIGLAGGAIGGNFPRLLGAMAGALPQGILNMGPQVAGDLENIAVGAETLAGKIKGAPAVGDFARSPQGWEYLDPRRWAMAIGEQGPLTAALAAAYVANPVLGTALMFGVEGGETINSLNEYEKQTGTPINPNVKAFAAAIVGATNALFEKFGIESMLGKIPGLKSKVIKALLAPAGEGGTEVLQEINQMLAEYYGADAPLFTPDNWDRLKQSLYGGIVLGFAGGAGTQVGEMAAERRNQGMKNKEQPYQPGEQPQEDLRQAGQIGPGEAPGSPRIDAMTDPSKTTLEGESAQQAPENASDATATEPTLEEPAMSEMDRKRAELQKRRQEQKERDKRRQQIIDQSGTQTEAERIEEAQQDARRKQQATPAKTVREWVRRKGRISSQGLKEYGFGEGSRENQALLLQIGSQNGAGVDEMAQQAIDEGVIPPPPADTNPADWFMQQVKDDALTQEQQLADLERQAQERESGGEALPPLPKEKPIRGAKDLQQAFISEMNLPEDQAGAAAAVYDAVAGAWAKASGKSKADWYKERIAGVQQRGNPDVEDVLFQFAGPESETADKHALTTAQKLIEDGIRPSEVRRKTGWFKGLDGKWRYEISDNDSSLNEAEYEKLKDDDEIYLSDLLEHDKLYAAYPAFRVTPVRIDNSRNGAVFYPKSGWIETQKEGLPPKQFRSVLLHEIQHIIQTQEGFASGGNTEIAPQIKNALGYLVEDKNLEILKWEDENGQTIKEAQDAAKMLRNAYLYRDVQKLIDYSHHDRPSSLRRHILNMGQWLYDPIFKDASEEIQSRAHELERRIYNMPKRHKMRERNQFLRDYSFDLAELLRDLIPPKVYQQFKNDPRKLTSFVKAFERQYSRAQAKLKPRGKKVRELQAVKRTKEATEFKTPFEIYEALYGEIEARNTQARADMTDEERRDTSPERTQDVPNEEAIIFYNGKSVQAPMMANLRGRDVLQQRKKGAVQFLADSRAIIHAFNQADVSTALHELAHIFRRDLSPEDQQTVLDWAKADSFTTEVEEKFARAFERYLYEGKAPNAKLKAIFEKLKTWLREIYKQFKGSAIDVNISPKIQAIFDKVLTGEAVQQQQKPAETKSPGAQESGSRPISGRYDVGDYAVTNPSIMNMPEIVELAKAINAGRVPRIRERLAARSAQGVFKPGSGRIELLAQLFKDPERAKRTLAHEIGHLVDWLPDENLSRGNILGRIASLKKHMKHMLVEHVGSIYNVITPEERERLRKEAREMTRGRGPKAAKEKYQDLLSKEIKRRGLFDLKRITAELKDLTHIWKPFDATSDPKYTKYRYKSEELYADAFSVLLNDPALLKEVAPTFYRAFFNYIDAKPEVKRVYDEIQRKINNPEELYEDRRQRVRKSQAKGSEAKQHEAKSIRERAFDQLIDANGPLLRRIRKAEEAGKEIAPDDNPRYWIEKLPYISSQINQYLRDIDKMVVKVAEDAGLSMADLGELMFYRRIAYGDRGKLANPLGFTPEDALANMGYMRQKMTSQQWEALTKAVEAFRAIREEQILPFLRKSGMYSDELMELLESSQHYSTFDIFHHRLQQIGGTEPRVSAITGQIHKQIGTFSETSNPFIATIMKDAALIRAASRKMASEKMIKFLVQEGEAVPAELYYNGKFMAPKRPNNPDYELLAYMDKGKIVGYWVPKDIEKLINKELQRFDGVGEIFGKIMRPVKEAFVGKNPFWAYWNAQRDFWGFLTKVPEAKMSKFIKVLAQSVPDAYRDAFLGESTEYVKQMYIDREIISGRHWDARERGSSENELDVMLKSFGIRPAPAKNWRRALNFLLDALEKPGQFTERWVKIAGKKYLQQYTAYTPEEISHIVRVRAGSPDFYRRGEWYHAYNNLFLFGNAGKEGLRSAIEGYRSSKGAFVWRMVQYNMLPKLVMRLAEAGLIGAIWSGLSGDDEEDIQEYFKAIPDYDKTNYHIIPMGRSENGIPIYLRFPLDFTGQIFGALFWKFTGALQKKDLEEMKEIPAIVYGGLPYSSINPVPMVGSNWMQYLVFDNNPYDYFYGEHVISQKAFKARDHRALLELTWHSFNMLGGGMIYKRPSIYDPDPVTPFEKMLRAPVVGPAMQRLVKVSDAGIRQEARKQTDKEERIKSRNSLRIDEDIQDHLKSLTVDPSLADANKLWNKLKEDNPEAGKFPAFKRKYFKFVARMIGSSIERALSRANTWIKRKNLLEAYLDVELTDEEVKTKYNEIMGKYNPKAEKKGK